MPDGQESRPFIDRELTDEEINAILVEADENMPDLPTLMEKHLSGKSILGLTPEDLRRGDWEAGDDDPDDPWFASADVDEAEETGSEEVEP